MSSVSETSTDTRSSGSGAGSISCGGSGAGVTVTRLTSGGPLGIADTCIEAYLADVASAGVLINETNRMSVTAGTPWTFSGTPSRV